MSYRYLDYELNGQVAVIRLNDPATLNAFSTEMGEELFAAIARGEAEARCLLLGSVGRAFSSGAKLVGDAAAENVQLRDMGARLESLFNPMVRRIKGASVPVVTAVRGAAAGIGCAIALLGDLIVCGESAYFYQAFRNIGLIPDGGSAYLLASAIGRVRAMEMMLLGTKVPAAQALEWGLVSRVVPDAELDATALALAQELASGPASLGLIRASAWAALESGFEAQLDRERVMQRAAGLTSDFNEGVAAFRAKRRPQFTGR